MRHRPQTLLLLAAGGLTLLSGCSSLRVDKAAQVAAGITSHWVCSDTFVSGLDPDRSFADRVRPQPGMGLVAWALGYEVDRGRREVRAHIGSIESRAVYREGYGCLNVAQPGDEAALPADAEAPPPVAEPPVTPPSSATMQAALASAFAEPEGRSRHRTQAVVVLQDGRLVAERYADGIGPGTPLLGFSMTKSVTNALLGVLVRQGRLVMDQPASIGAWADLADPRHAITPDQLLRQTSGLDLPQTNSGFDPTSQIMYAGRDKAGLSAAAPLEAAPGTHWRYTDAHFMLLSRLLRDAVGGDAASVRRFARDELFGPLGMRHATLEFDTTGTPIGSSHMLASARDWARLGQLFLDDGVVDGRRLLPEGWVRYSATPTLATGYGAGWWTNRLPGLVPGWGVPWGLPQAPADAFFARGFMGQFVVVVPSRRLVVVRLSMSEVRGDDIDTTDRLVAGVLSAL